MAATAVLLGELVQAAAAKGSGGGNVGGFEGNQVQCEKN